ncbi:hypothetical protein DPMN_186342 [Dreissena polymorpha]|uniref:Uncharacterized protein n=1 Tax=Dreissena polymorpha TaxID=45954 RepID=A0A9D4DLE3_DREPO|nr:hypothetical protein DPMN_186342 [Dreissena polymorpha]
MIPKLTDTTLMLFPDVVLFPPPPSNEECRKGYPPLQAYDPDPTVYPGIQPTAPQWATGCQQGSVTFYPCYPTPHPYTDRPYPPLQANDPDPSVYPETQPTAPQWTTGCQQGSVTYTLVTQLHIRTQTDLIFRGHTVFSSLTESIFLESNILQQKL